MMQFATEYANEGSVSLEKIFTPGNIKFPRTQGALIQLESFHKVLKI
jgi:ATP-dependent RNA helicase SUPV3L1/SUV3